MTPLTRNNSPPDARGAAPSLVPGRRAPARGPETAGGEAPPSGGGEERAEPLLSQEASGLFPLLPGGRGRRAAARVLRGIQSFVQDDRGLWVAQLECGHLVDVSPDAPPPAPEWTRTEHGRQNLKGSLLACPRCLSEPTETPAPTAAADAEEPPRSWRSFWLRPKERPSRVQPTWVDSKVACGSVRTVQDIEELARSGFRDVLSLDQAGEPGQALSPHFEASWARTLDMTPHWVPIDPVRITDRDVDRFLEVLRSIRGPVLVHSNGARRAHALAAVWLGVVRGLDGSEALRAAAGAGFLVDERDRELAREQLKRLLGREDRAHVAPELFEIIRWETDGGSVAVEGSPRRSGRESSGASSRVSPSGSRGTARSA